MVSIVAWDGERGGFVGSGVVKGVTSSGYVEIGSAVGSERECQSAVA